MTGRTAVLLIVLATWTVTGYQYGTVWQSNLSLWEHTARMQPYNLWVQKNYGTALIEAKQTDEACWQLEYIQRLATTDRVLDRDRAHLPEYLLDRVLALAYFDHQGRGVTGCRDDSVLAAEWR